MRGDPSTGDDVISLYPSETPWRVHVTGGGSLEASQEAVATVPGVGDLTFIALDGGPNLLSTGELVKLGYTFEWSNYYEPRLWTPSGTLVDNVGLHNGVPAIYSCRSDATDSLQRQAVFDFVYEQGLIFQQMNDPELRAKRNDSKRPASPLEKVDDQMGGSLKSHDPELHQKSKRTRSSKS